MTGSERVEVKPSGRYHHGSLRAALAAAALELVAERGPGGVTMKDAATAAGVTTAAPYRHFPDKEHLLAAAAAPGYARLLDRLSAVREADPAQRLATLMATFVEWALTEPATHRILFAAGIDKSAHPELATISAAATRLFTDAATAVIADPGRAERLMVSAFAIAQGHAAIAEDPTVAAGGTVTRADVGPLTERAVLALARATAAEARAEA